MTKLQRDILRQPEQFRRMLGYHRQNGFVELAAAAALIRDAVHLVVVGMGASHNAGWALLHAFNRHGRLATLVDASEFEAMPHVPQDCVVVFLSRSGKSIELIRGAERCARAGIRTLALTNDRHSPVAITVVAHVFLNVDFDHAVSVVTYTAIVLLGGLLAAYSFSPGNIETGLADAAAGCDATERLLPVWRNAIEALDRSVAHRFTYFLGRVESLCSAQAGMLLWQEVAKVPAVALTTGAFRHGPQEVLRAPMAIVVWLSQQFALSNDMCLAEEISTHGSYCITLGPRPPRVVCGLHFEVPAVQPEWAGAFNVIPVQLLAEAVARWTNVDCDSFLLASYVVEKDAGLI